MPQFSSYRTRGRSYAVILLFFLMLFVAACGGESAIATRPPMEIVERDGVVFPTLPSTEEVMDAARDGILVLDGECLYSVGGVRDRAIYILWPHGYSFQRNDDDRIEILNEDGDVVATEGDRIRLSGGASNPERDRLQPLPEQCDTDSFWITGDTVRVLQEHELVDD